VKHLIIRSFIGWVLLVGLLSTCLVAEDYRTIQRNTIITTNNGEKHKVGDFGNYYALLIYVEEYQNLKDLQTPKKDVEAISKILKDRYGFIETKIVENPRNSDALIKVLDEFKNRLKEHDNLLIYYAGHGSKNGYWQLSSAEQKTRVGWISVKEAINQTLSEIRSKHVLVVADSCYSGYLTRDGVSLNNLNPNDKKYYSKLYEMKSRNVLTSGGLQPVLDRDPSNPNHSVFANGFLKMLKKNSRAVFSLEEQYPKVKRYVQLNSESQIPLYGDVKLTGHEDGGDFIFLDRKSIVLTKITPYAQIKNLNRNIIDLRDSVENMIDDILNPTITTNKVNTLSLMAKRINKRIIQIKNNQEKYNRFITEYKTESFKYKKLIKLCKKNNCVDETIKLKKAFLKLQKSIDTLNSIIETDRIAFNSLKKQKGVITAMMKFEKSGDTLTRGNVERLIDVIAE